MMNFLKKARKNLTGENRTLKFLRYAVGEIILVVVDILIALQINNANENNKTEQKELILLMQMQQNLKEDLADAQGNLKGNLKRIRANEMVLLALKNNIPLNDSLKYRG